MRKMFAKQTETKINEALVLELTNASKTYGKEYHSLHEGYAVLLEKVEEAEQDFDYIKNHLALMWDDTKENSSDFVKASARAIAINAVELAKEAVQIGAVARKILGEGV